MRVSSSEAFCGRFRSTRISGRSDAGKNWFCTKRMENTAKANNRTVRIMAVQALRMHQSNPLLKALPMRPGSSAWGLTSLLRICTPSTGANSTATIHETIMATAITANRVKVYSPAMLSLRPMGTKPATVTKVPVSIGNAVEV
ncbi:hypothetical protein D9M73_205420 [compost metagenome]